MTGNEDNMSAKGFYPAQEGHIVLALPPVSITDTATCQAFSMATYSHATILVLIGASAGPLTSIVVNECTDAAGTDPVGIPFDIFTQTTPGGDVLSERIPVSILGYFPISPNDNIFYIIELDEIPWQDLHHPYIQVVLHNPLANSVMAAVLVVLYWRALRRGSKPERYHLGGFVAGAIAGGGPAAIAMVASGARE